MTDEEQKQIEQLARDLKLIKSLQASEIYTPTYQEAMALFSIGYRKAGEVRKETARELLQELFNEAVQYGKTTVGIEWMAQKYGVEVEE